VRVDRRLERAFVLVREERHIRCAGAGGLLVEGAAVRAVPIGLRLLFDGTKNSSREDERHSDP
jgi:hypothetical protein